MIFAFDLDNTVCERKLGNMTYFDVNPFPEAVETIRWLKSEGHTIILHTGRHMRTCGGNQGKVLAKQGKILFDWLEKHQIPYDEIWWSKPHADLFIDDAVHRHTDWKTSIQAIKDRLIKGDRTAENP
jgi:capsule biosynthesis phosphatase